MGDLEDLWAYRCDGLRPDKRYSVTEWADAHRILPASTSAEHGRWRTSRVPYMKDVMDALSPSSPYETIVLMKASQVGGSEVGFNWLGFIIDVAPAPTMIVLPTKDTMKRQSSTRISPMIAATPRIAQKVSEAKSRAGSNTALLKEFAGGLLAMAGANSSSDLRALPIQNLFLDEVDDYPEDVDGQGDPIDLARARTKTFRKKKVFLCSSPTIAGKSRIEAAYKKTQRMRLWVPCLHCNSYQILQWKQIKWQAGDPDNAWYACEHCGVAIQNHEKTEMLSRYEWRPEDPDYVGNSIGFHLPAFYSPVGFQSWGEIARAWVDAGQDESKLKVVRNTMFGETWQPTGEVPDWERLYNRVKHYARNTVPAGGLVLTGGADVQRDYIQAEAVAWGRGLENWSVDIVVFTGDTSDPDSEAWAGLSQWLERTFEHESGSSLRVRSLAIDTGYNTQAVYNWCRQYPISRVIPVKGSSSAPVLLGMPRAVDVYQGSTKGKGRRIKRALKLWTVGVDIAKMELYGNLRLTSGPGSCHFPLDYEEEFYRQLTGEQLVQRELRGGRSTYEWEKIRERNEALDVRVYARAAAALLQLDQFQARHWDRMEEAVTGVPPPPAPPRGREGVPVGNVAIPTRVPFIRSRREQAELSAGVRL